MTKLAVKIGEWIARIGLQIFKPKSMLNKNDIVIDVSHHNGVIDWAKVAKDPLQIKGAILKATEGATGKDNKLAANIGGCVRNALKWGAYHFATWNNENEVLDATQEANHFLDTIQSQESIYGKPSLPLVLDIESNTAIPYTKQEMVDFVSAFVGTIKAAGYDVAIYGSPGFLNSYLPTNHPFTDLKLWIADYTGSINPVPGWKQIWMHQYTEKGSVQGIAGTTDMNRVLNP